MMVTFEQAHFMYVSNLHDYGHLLNADNYETTHLHNDMFSMFDNRVVSHVCVVVVSGGCCVCMCC